MINILKVMDKHNIKEDEFTTFLHDLFNQYTQKQIVEKAHVDKNVVHRLKTNQNITLDNFKKIESAFPEVFKKNTDGLAELPLLGQIIEDHKVRVLNPSQPKNMTVPKVLMEFGTPCYGYINVSSTGYNTSVHLFTEAGINNTSINNQCINRLIIAHFEDKAPLYSFVVSDTKKYLLLNPRTRAVCCEVPFKNNIRWAKWFGLSPQYLTENGNDELKQDIIPFVKINWKPTDC